MVRIALAATLKRTAWNSNMKLDFTVRKKVLTFLFLMKKYEILERKQQRRDRKLFVFSSRITKDSPQKSNRSYRGLLHIVTNVLKYFSSESSDNEK